MWRSAFLLEHALVQVARRGASALQHARDMHGPARTGLAVLVLVAAVTGLRSPYYSLRERPPSSCGFAHFGSATGSAQQLVETHLSPGVADWNIVVPMPPPCAQARLTGVHMRVCDGDAPPDVSLSDAHSARVHRTGALAGFAAVNVTVYCILPPPPALPSHLAASRSTYEMLSKELSSNDGTSNEEISSESESIELFTTVKPYLSTTLAPTPEETTAQVEITSPAEVITPLPHKTTKPKEKSPQSLKVTINITPTHEVSSKEDVSQSDDAELPSLSNKEKPDEVMSSQRLTLPSLPLISTPPRISGSPPRKRTKQPRGLSRPLGANPPRAPLPPRGPPRPPRPPRRRPGASRPPQYVMPPYALTPAPYPAPYPVAPMYSPLSLYGPRLSFLQRHQPLLIIRHY